MNGKTWKFGLHMHSVLHIFWFAYCIGYMLCKVKLQKCIFYAYCVSISNRLNSATMFKINTFITPSKSSCWLLSSIRFQLQFYSAAYYSCNTWRKNAQAAYTQICNMQSLHIAYSCWMHMHCILHIQKRMHICNFCICIPIVVFFQ